MNIKWKEPRKYLWTVNVVRYNYQRIRRTNRDKKLWVFGAWDGEKYDDNSRALFEYVAANHSEAIRVVWLTKYDYIVDYVRKRGYEAFRYDSTDGKEIARKAGVAIYTNGLSDFGFYLNVGGAYIVSLWHGVGFKKIYNDKYSGLALQAKRIMDFFFSWTHRDLTIATSEYVKRQFSGIFGLNEKNAIVIAGQPRNDIFKDNLQKKEVLRNLNIDYSKRLIIYLPTYRSKEMGNDAMKKIVEELYYNQDLDNVLNETNSIFVAKLHPLTPHIALQNRQNFITLDYGAVESNQELLAVSDVLITDYSSCCVDYALLLRPIIFYQPDEKMFLSKSEPLYEELLEILHTNRSTNPVELAEKLANPSLEVVDKLNEVFEDVSIRNTHYSENVFNAIVKNANIIT